MFPSLFHSLKVRSMLAETVSLFLLYAQELAQYPAYSRHNQKCVKWMNKWKIYSIVIILQALMPVVQGGRSASYMAPKAS